MVPSRSSAYIAVEKRQSGDMRNNLFKKEHRKLFMFWLIILLVCLVLAVLIILFIVLPLVVKYSFSIQQKIVFTHGYADSSKGTLTEARVVNDCKQLYSWIRNKTQANIYVWGQSLGSSLAANTVLQVEKDGLQPKGLILESAFTSFEDELYVHPYGKIFAWLPWFYVTVVKPLRENGFIFDTSSYLKKIKCSVMILHAQDDSVVPYRFGRKLYEISSNRTGTAATSIYHEFDASLEYNHYFIYQDPFLKYYIMQFIGKNISLVPVKVL
ncbi:unnamed protein product [Acanthoscelides obtectus]|uniref:Uncharacterized protein n=1 Tax=Acanthoscelides obtectus TaxID=200917 RepID=A0A9P0KUZ4_ACAOB|nr:unnamed protein product [Acanthoscelides obtectus]CAK1676167.1 Monoacylglycerol lipase ABHD12 [Acanthoscelides obtectus]